VVVDGFLAGRLQRLGHAQPRRLGCIDPPGEGRKPFGHRQRVVIDNVVDTRLGRERRDRGGDRIIDVNERPDGIAVSDDRRLALAG